MLPDPVPGVDYIDTPPASECRPRVLLPTECGCSFGLAAHLQHDIEVHMARKKTPTDLIGKPIVTGPIPTPPLIVFDDLESFNVAKLPAGGSTLAIRIDDGTDWHSVEVFDGGTGEKIGELVGGRVVMLDGTERTITANTEGRWSPNDVLTVEEAAARLVNLSSVVAIPGGPAEGRPVQEPVPVGYAALLAPLRAEFPAPILPELPITDAEWSAMIEAIRTSTEDVIALRPPFSCCDEVWTGVPGEAGCSVIAVVNEAALRACADALRVTACALGVGLTFYPRFESVHRDRSGKEPRSEVIPAALMVRRARV